MLGHCFVFCLVSNAQQCVQHQGEGNHKIQGHKGYQDVEIISAVMI